MGHVKAAVGKFRGERTLALPHSSSLQGKLSPALVNLRLLLAPLLCRLIILIDCDWFP